MVGIWNRTSKRRELTWLAVVQASLPTSHDIPMTSFVSSCWAICIYLPPKKSERALLRSYSMNLTLKGLSKMSHWLLSPLNSLQGHINLVKISSGQILKWKSPRVTVGFVAPSLIWFAMRAMILSFVATGQLFIFREILLKKLSNLLLMASRLPELNSIFQRYFWFLGQLWSDKIP